MMKLIRFRVKNFRSVDDSGWIEIDDITALIGTNEAGKTNLLLPLWKLKPAKDGEINPIADFPRKRFNEIRNMEKKPVFIQAQFELSEDLAREIVELTKTPIEWVRVALVERNLNGGYHVGFPEVPIDLKIPKTEIEEHLTQAQAEISSLHSLVKEESLKTSMLFVINNLIVRVNDETTIIDKDLLLDIKSTLNNINTDNKAKNSTLISRFGQLIDIIDEIISRVSPPHPNENGEARNLVIRNLTSFVYYSNYGNLDSEIYLPQVIENMERDNLGSKEGAKSRTLRVLFEFVQLEPKEILALGESLAQIQRGPSEEEIRSSAEKTKERDILLQSASTDLTQKFRDWWKQGQYRFRFQADGRHFRIWVSDDKRPEDIELENRSTGLQWFLSFFLVFLVESSGAHKNSILLLDEPGLSLHPLAQKDLSIFFAGLSKTNQLIYTTHSPFMVDPDHLDRVKAVYVDDKGNTMVSADLRGGEKNRAQSHSVYPVHAALGLSISEMFMVGCQGIIVEGPSDQLYLSSIKTFLISQGQIKPKRELVFLPAGGVRGVTSLCAILASKDEKLPYVVLDSDGPGKEFAKSLKDNLYKADRDRVVMIGDITGIDGTEIEDLFPVNLLASIFSKLFPGQEEDFDEVIVTDKSFIKQVEEYANKYELILPLGWKVDVATKTKERIRKDTESLKNNTSLTEQWGKLFLKISS